MLHTQAFIPGKRLFYLPLNGRCVCIQHRNTPEEFERGLTVFVH